MNFITQSFLNPVNYSPAGGMPGGGTQALQGQGGDVGKLLQDLSQLIDGQQSGAGGTNDVGQFLKDLAGVLGGQQGGQGMPGAQGMPGMQSPTMGGQPGTMPPMGSTGSASPMGSPAENGLGSAGQGMHNIKINSKAGGDALHLQEDSQGNLYNASGNNVGHMGADGTVSLNSGATKEAATLETGHSDGKMNIAQVFGGGGLTKPSTGDGGNKVFDSSQVSVSSGDLNQKNDV